jgi:hypothetical protein
MASVKFWIDLFSAFSALGAASFWLKASLIKTPREIPHTKNLRMLDGDFGSGVLKLANGVSIQSRLNAYAAAFAALAAVLTAISVLIGTRWE